MNTVEFLFTNKSIVSKDEKFPDPSRTATVGLFGGKTGSMDYKVFIVGEEDATPHFYLQCKKEGERGHYIAKIKIKDFKVMGFKAGRKRRLPKKLFELFRVFLDKTNPIFKIPNWIIMLKDWNSEHLIFKKVWVKEDMPIPDVDDFKYAPKFGL